jgi:hypothetical protein
MNYYLRPKPCDKCGHAEFKKHIGKSSSGWEFYFQGYPDESIVSYVDWIREFSSPEKEIINEIGQVIKFCDFNDMVCIRELDLLNMFNVTKGVPLTPKEKEYCASRHNQYGMSSDSRAWKDDQGFAFTETDFS